MPAVAATNPPVLIAILAAATARIRLGSGGVMLPNHAPLVIAEQFALLEAAYPDRIDLGRRTGARFGPGDQPPAAGRPPGPGRHLRRRSLGPVADDAARGCPAVPRRALLPPGRHPRGADRAEGVAARLVDVLRRPGRLARAAVRVRAPLRRRADPRPPWSATAASSSRRRRRPEPTTIAVVNAAVAATQEEADRLTLGQRRSMWRLRSGQTLAAAGAGRGRRGRSAARGRPAGRRRLRPQLVRRHARVGRRRGHRAGRGVRHRRGDGLPHRRRLPRHPVRRQPGPRGDPAAAGQRADR